MNLLDKPGSTAYDSWRVPENEVYEAMHMLRRKLTTWLRQSATQREVPLRFLFHLPSCQHRLPPAHYCILVSTSPNAIRGRVHAPLHARAKRQLAPSSQTEKSSRAQLDLVMNSVLRVSASTGTLLPRPDEVPNRWAFVLGERNVGRFSLHSSRSKPLAGSSAALDSAASVGGKASGSRKPKKGAQGAARVKASDAASPADGESSDQIPTVADSSDLAVEVDTQVMQLTLKASHPQALPTEVARQKDVLDIFGQVSMQACLTEQSVSRACYRLVGRAHDIAHWPNKDPKLPLLDLTRAYYPEELYPSEKIWLPSVFEPVRWTYLLFPKPLEVFLQEEALPEDAQVAYLVGKQPDQGGVWRTTSGI